MTKADAVAAALTDYQINDRILFFWETKGVWAPGRVIAKFEDGVTIRVGALNYFVYEHQFAIVLRHRDDNDLES